MFQDTGINDWQVLKNKNGILVQKEKRRLVNRDDAAVIKGTVAIRCDPKRVFHVLPPLFFLIGCLNLFLFFSFYRFFPTRNSIATSTPSTWATTTWRM